MKKEGSNNFLKTIKRNLSGNQDRYYLKVIKISQKWRELLDKKDKNLSEKIGFAYYTVRRNNISPKRNVWLQGKIGKNIKIYHANVIVNEQAAIGDNVIFHGNNCIGNNGKDPKACPKIGNNVDFGYGACAYGNITIADNTTIGAGAIVVKSILEENTIVGGVPAKIIKTRTTHEK